MLLPYIYLPNPILKQTRGDEGFGSTEVSAWTQEITRQRPLKTIKVEGKNIQGLLDTGADSCFTVGKNWLGTLPIVHTTSTLVGLGLASNVAQSSKILTRQCEGKVGTFQPYIISSLPFSLWRRDILVEMKVKLTTDENWNDQHFS